MWVSYVMLWTLVISFSIYSTVLKLIEAISQHCCTPIRTQSVYSVIIVSACIWVCWLKDIRTHTQLKKCTNGYYTLTQTYTHIHLDISVTVLETLLTHAVKRDALRPSRRMMWSGTDGVIRRLKTPPFSLTDKQTRPRMWRTIERWGRLWGVGMVGSDSPSEQEVCDWGQQLGQLRLDVGRLSDGVATEIEALQPGAGGQRLEICQCRDFCVFGLMKKSSWWLQHWCKSRINMSNMTPGY